MGSYQTLVFLFLERNITLVATLAQGLLFLAASKQTLVSMSTLFIAIFFFQHFGFQLFIVVIVNFIFFRDGIYKLGSFWPFV